ncbi:MAG TPA: UDP-N-acetylmuramoyl-tripeptide--D-alanyl-D-alanine ligase [Methylococcus sp.]|nr:UDP-N-acetylmuramoyl-tripeptide--D-alanyl-D-alanine ligase [Methylococcus sp.]
MMTLAELMESISNATLRGDAAMRFTSVSTDTRTIQNGALFFALRGEKFDAHDFAGEAVEHGAVALVVERPLAVAVPQILVPDVRRALGEAAAGWRARFELPVIAVTGSNGKTTVTQMIGSILAAEFGPEHRLVTRGNLNNAIGVPLMLFELARRHRAAVLELGMNHAGEIDYLARLARPTAALVVNAQREHQEFLHTVEATAYENGATISLLPQDGMAVLPADDDCIGIWRRLAQTRPILDFGLAVPAALTARYRWEHSAYHVSIESPRGPIDLHLHLAGEHQVRNALAAAAAAFAIGVSPTSIRIGLESFQPVSGRGVVLRATSGARLIDDTYNANPDSVRAAIDVLAAYPSPRILVLGDMGEVGTQGPAFHREIGSYAHARGIDTLLGLGSLCTESVAAFREAGGSGRHFSSMDGLIGSLRSAAGAEATVLVKGSRFMRMERAIHALQAQASEPEIRDRA